MKNIPHGSQQAHRKTSPVGNQAVTDKVLNNLIYKLVGFFVGLSFFISAAKQSDLWS